MGAVKSVSILGVTGSVGQSTADVIAHNAAMFDVDVVTANNDVSGLAQAAQRLNAKRAVIADISQENALQDALKGSGIAALAGQDALEHAVGTGTDICVAAISGIAGLKPLMGALKNSKAVAIANKEPLVAAGELVIAEARKYGCKILPIDSEHNAIFQVFDEQHKSGIRKILLTASGGPFLGWGSDRLSAVTPEEAVKHPNWDMGAKISVDSATMMNKALEVIEAYVLFDLPAEQIEVVLHPQSIVHSMVEYKDGSVLSQMGPSDMRTPIAYALGYPARIETPGAFLDFSTGQNLSFEKVSAGDFLALDLAYKALSMGQGACLALNAANEVAVAAFLDGKIGFTDICKVNAHALDHIPDMALNSLDSISEADHAVRRVASTYIDRISSKNDSGSAELQQTKGA